MEVALLHVWNSGHSISDSVWQSWRRLWPHADLHTATLAETSYSSADQSSSASRWELDRVSPPDETMLLPLYPTYDMILSTSPAAAAHFSMCKSRFHLSFLPHAVSIKSEVPTRTPLPGRLQMPVDYHPRLTVSRHAYLPAWDQTRCQLPEQVTHWISASRTVRELNALPTSLRSLVLYPPVDTNSFRPEPKHRENFYLVVCRDQFPSGIRLAVEACTRLGRPIVIATSVEMIDSIPADLRTLAQVYHKESALSAWYNRCAGVIFPGVVDYDRSMLEAQACGAPIIAFRGGAALEFVIDAEEGEQGTGLFFDQLTPESLISTIQELERRPQRCSASLGWSCAAAYSAHHFEKRTGRLIREVLNSQSIRILDREFRNRDAA